MKYRVCCDLAFADEATARELWSAVKGKKSNAVIINLGKLNEEQPSGNLHECYHDEPEPRPCKIIEKL